MRTPSSRARRGICSWLHCGSLLALLVGTTLQAQVGSDTLMVARAVRRLDPTLLRPVSLLYTATLRADSVTRTLGERRLQIAQTTYAGIPVWLLLDSYGANENATLDSMYVDAAFVPLHWGYVKGFAPASGRWLTTVVAEFRADSVFGGMTAPTGRREIVSDVPAGTFLTDAMTEAALTAYPLGIDFRDSVQVRSGGFSKWLNLRAELAVLGEERVTVPAGTFDCWLVTLTTDAGGPTYWVSKRDRVVVKSSRIVPESRGALVYELSRLERR